MVHEYHQTLHDAIINSLAEYQLDHKNFIAFCADNANVNFGGKNRGGKQNVFYKLKQSNHDVWNILLI